MKIDREWVRELGKYQPGPAKFLRAAGWREKWPGDETLWTQQDQGKEYVPDAMWNHLKGQFKEYNNLIAVYRRRAKGGSEQGTEKTDPGV